MFKFMWAFLWARQPAGSDDCELRFNVIVVVVVVVDRYGIECRGGEEKRGGRGHPCHCGQDSASYA